MTYKGAALTILPKEAPKPRITIKADGCTYDGAKKKPALKVMVGDVVIPASEYKVTYSNNVLPGKASVTVEDVKGGNFNIGKTTATYRIEKTVFSVKAKARGSDALAYTWGKVAGAQGYDVFFSRCCSDGVVRKLKLNKTVKAGKTLALIKTGLKNGVSYKAQVKAWAMVDGRKVYLAETPVAHAYTGGKSAVHTNGKSLKVDKTRVTLKAGNTTRITATETKLYPQLALNEHVKPLRYYSTNRGVATVGRTGVIRAKARGKCAVIVFTPDGISQRIEVTVK